MSSPVQIPKPPLSWNDVAAKLDPMMSQDDYDMMRQHYFATHVQPYVPQMQQAAYWQNFKDRTERPKVIESPLLAQTKLAALSAGGRAEELLNKLPGPQSEGLIKARDNLQAMMKRDGISTDVSTFVGSSVPDLAAFAALEAGTEGAATFLGAGAEASAMVARASALLKGTTFANRVARGSLMFGTFEAITAQKGEPVGYAFARGMGTGAAWEVGLAGLGKLVGGGKGISEALRRKRASDMIQDLATPKETEAELASTMGKPEAPILDQALAQHVQQDQELIRKKGLPLALKVDNRSPYVRLMGTRMTQAGAQPFTIEVKRYAEGKAVQELQGYLQGGGQLHTVLSNEMNPGALIDTLGALRTLDQDQTLKLSMLKSAVDERGQPLKDWSPDKADAFLTGVERKLDALERERQARMSEAGIDAYFGNTPPSESEQIARRVMQQHRERILQNRQQEAEAMAKDFREDGVAQPGSATYPQFTLRDGVRGSRGLYADATVRIEPEDPLHSHVLTRPEEKQQFYVRIDGELARWNPQEGLPTDNWTPRNLKERQDVWNLMQTFFKSAQGAKDASTQAARKELKDYVLKSLAEDPKTPPLGTPRYRTQAPTLPDLTAILMKHETPEGFKLTAGEAVENAKRIYSLWDRSITDTVKQVNALALRDKGVEELVPPQWRWTVSQPASRVVDEAFSTQLQDALVDSQVGSKVSPEGYLTNKTYRYSDIAPMIQKGMTDQQIVDETGLAMKKISRFREMFKNGAKMAAKAPDLSALRLFWQNPTIPASDLLYTGKWKMTGGFLDLMVDPRMIKEYWGKSARAGAVYWENYGAPSIEELQRHLPFVPEGLDPATRVRGIRLLPFMAQSKMDIENTLYHERLHIDLNTLRDNLTENLYSSIWSKLDDTTKQTIDNIVKDFEKPNGLYKGTPVLRQIEEAFVGPAGALRAGDEQLLKQWGLRDTSTVHVVDMLENMSTHILGELEKLPDIQELRTLKTRLEDLQRRTGYDWYGRMQRAALRQEKYMRLNGEKQTWDFSDRSRTVSFASKSSKLDTKALADYLDQQADFTEAVPSVSMQFEQMGLTGPVFDAQMVRAGEHDIPQAEFLPKSGDNFRGLSALSALFTPMLSWAARTEQAFSKRGLTTNLYNLVKDVDDKIREGTAWHDNALASVAKLIPADSSKAKLIMPFLSSPEEAVEATTRTRYTTPANYVTRGMPLSRTPQLGKPEYFNGETNWTQLAEKLGVDQKFLDNVRNLQQWINNFQTDTGIQINHYLRHDLPRLQNMNFSPQAVWPRGLDKSDLNRMARAVVDGDIKPQDPHIGHLLSWAIREGFEAKYTEQPLRALQKLVNAKDSEGKSLLGVARYNVDNYIRYVKGIPDATQQVMFKAVGDLQKNLGTAFAQVNRKFGKKLLPEDFSSPGNIWQQYMLLSYAGGIGLRPAIWARDAMQGVTNTLPVLGLEKFTKGMQSLFRKGAWDEAMGEGALLGLHNFQSLYGDIFQELSPQSGGVMDKLVDASGKMLSPSRWGHNVARMVAYFGERDSALPLVKAFRANKIDFGEFMNKTSTWFFDQPVQERFRKMLLEKESDLAYKYSDHEMAKRLALELVDNTLWAYRRGTQPQFLRTGVGRVFGQYGLWPLSYMDFLKRLTGKLATNPQAAMRTIGYWYAANKAASATFSAAGGDVSKWFFISPSGYGGSPHLAAAQALMESPENSQQGREARKTLLEYPMNFIPAYLELKNVAHYISDGGQFFNQDWSLTDDAVRILGMHPKSPDLDLTPEEQIQYETGFSHRR